LNTIHEISNKVIQCSQSDRLEIIISLRAFLFDEPVYFWFDFSDLNKAEQILEENLAPNTICYNAVIDAYARGRSIGKAYRAELLLEKMLEESEKGNTLIRPDTITFNSVINAAARSFGDPIVRREAYLIGLGAFKKIHEYEHCNPSSITYVLFLNVLKNLVEEGDARDNMAERTFQLSVSLGLANGKVREQVRKTCSPLVAERILSSK